MFPPMVVLSSTAACCEVEEDEDETSKGAAKAARDAASSLPVSYTSCNLTNLISCTKLNPPRPMISPRMISWNANAGSGPVTIVDDDDFDDDNNAVDFRDDKFLMS